YGNTDYALRGMLSHFPLVKFMVLTYDIACQYSIKLLERFTSYTQAGIFPPSVLSAVKRLQLLVPKMHLQGHKDDCRRSLLLV
ncbi:hypothetical protein B0H14DRAFT_2283938, partial [Mycena olivaceomarginata]